MSLITDRKKYIPEDKNRLCRTNSICYSSYYYKSRCFLGYLLTFKMRVLIVVAFLAFANADSFPGLGAKCNIAGSIFWRLPSDQNPNTYYYCNNKVVTQGTCPPGTGFLKTGDETCTSFTSWSCLKYDLVLTCKNNQPGYLRGLANPNVFTFCRGDTVTVAPCAPNTGFATGPSSAGCMPWPLWNGITNCLES